MASGHPDSGKAVIDTACAMSVAGSEWFEDYTGLLRAFCLDHLLQTEPCREQFRFGNGGTLPSLRRVTVPAVICGLPMKISVCIVEGSKLVLLLGRDFLEQAQADVAVGRGLLRIGQHSCRLEQCAGGHFCIALKPESYLALLEVHKPPSATATSGPSASTCR